MMLSVPLAAPSLPPLIGASSMATPLALSCWPISTVLTGLIVLMSMTRSPAAAPSITPPSPNTTASTSGVSLTQMMVMSLAAATALGESAPAAPRSRKGSMRLAVRFQTVTAKPAFIKLSTMPRPMMPRPMNPIFSLILGCPRMLVPVQQDAGNGNGK